MHFGADAQAAYYTSFNFSTSDEPGMLTYTVIMCTYLYGQVYNLDDWNYKFLVLVEYITHLLINTPNSFMYVVCMPESEVSDNDLEAVKRGQGKKPVTVTGEGGIHVHSHTYIHM